MISGRVPDLLERVERIDDHGDDGEGHGDPEQQDIWRQAEQLRAAGQEIFMEEFSVAILPSTVIAEFNNTYGFKGYTYS